jgi:hypothetical protein
MKWLQAAANDGFPCYVLFERDRNLDNLRDDAEFKALMAKLKQQSQYYKSLLEDQLTTSVRRH